MERAESAQNKLEHFSVPGYECKAILTVSDVRFGLNPTDLVPEHPPDEFVCRICVMYHRRWHTDKHMGSARSRSSCLLEGIPPFQFTQIRRLREKIPFVEPGSIIAIALIIDVVYRTQ